MAKYLFPLKFKANRIIYEPFFLFFLYLEFYQSFSEFLVFIVIITSQSNLYFYL